MMNINQIMKQAQAMQKKMAEMQEKMASIEFTGSAGGGLVTVAINGKKELLRVKIDPSIVVKDDVEMLEDLIVAAFNDAIKKADDASEGEASSMLGGLGLPPGFKFPF
ncbi:MAG: YbaB/EbfC family nucleoid-associated protein [Alphaproteobacteria bacterium]